VVTPSAGQLVINEFLSLNVNDTTNEFGSHEDWIELYNKSSSPLNLYGLYLTDDYAFPNRSALPNKILPPGGYLIIWADGNASSPQNVHCNFNLSSLGEKIMLSNGSGSVVDSVTFGMMTQDSSIGRCPDGSGGFVKQYITTFKSANYCGNGINEYPGQDVSFTCYPSPASDHVTVIINGKHAQSIILTNSLGQKVYESVPVREVAIDVSFLPSGLYFLHSGEAAGKILIRH
jgi:hypothetical protein